MSYTNMFVRTLVLFTAILAILAGGAIIQWGQLNPLRPVAEGWGAGVTLGDPDAPVELVVIEDFLCPSCRVFHQKLFPKIRENYIETGKARYTMVPIPVVKGSGMLENAALEVYRQSPGLFFPFMDKILQTFRRGPSRAEGEQKLLEIARELGGINDLLLKQCIDTRCNRDLLQRNLDWARQRMGQEYVLPALYKDGQRISYEELVEVMK